MNQSKIENNQPTLQQHNAMRRATGILLNGQKIIMMATLLHSIAKW